MYPTTMPSTRATRIQTAAGIFFFIAPSPGWSDCLGILLPGSQDVACDFSAQRRAVDGDKEMAIGDREVEGGASLEAGNEACDELAIERVQLERFRAVDPLAGELREELRRRLVRIDGDARRGLARLVQSGRVGRADVDPGAKGAGQVANRDRRLVRVEQPAGKGDAFGEFQAVGEHSGGKMLFGLGRMPRGLEGELLVAAAVHVRQSDLEVVDQRGMARRVSKRRLSQTTTRSS